MVTEQNIMMNNSNKEFGRKISQVIPPMKEGASVEKTKILEELISKLESE